MIENLLIVFSGIVIWAVCGYIHYGWWFAYHQREFPSIAEESYSDDKHNALVTSLFGPIALFVDVIFRQYKHGRKYN